jgi:hypothetical protein
MNMIESLLPLKTFCDSTRDFESYEDDRVR